ncbi:MAG: VTT domain-containing protein [Gemmatimonadaceae bacterium]|nr:VTT domain-containing protein [Gemmatimonadaceae bacterium]
MTWSASSLWAVIERAAHARGAVPATFLWNLGQGSVVPGPAELLLLPLGLADPAKAWPLALAATTGSVLGGCIAYGLGAVAFASVGQPLLSMLGVSDAMLTRGMALMVEYGWLFIVGSTLTPISAKAVSIGAGAVGMPFPIFVSALTVGRVLRFSIDAVLIRASAGLLHRLRQRVFAR